MIATGTWSPGATPCGTASDVIHQHDKGRLEEAAKAYGEAEHLYADKADRKRVAGKARETPLTWAGLPHPLPVG
jgi:hypothetical protein